MALKTVAVEGFEGPLDLLLNLIEEEKLDVSRVSLALVTNQYLETIRGLDGMEPEAIAEFLVVAGRLILIKSQRLLPHFTVTNDEEENILSLEQQLKDYQKYREKAKILQQTWLNSQMSFGRDGFLNVTAAFFPPQKFSCGDLQASMATVVRGLPVIGLTRDEAQARIISLEQRINEIKERINKAIVSSFKETVKGTQKADVVISFLALLELVKQKIVRVEQNNSFQDIMIHKRYHD